MDDIVRDKVPSLERCAFCEHARMSHRNTSYSVECNICREPCSYIFIPVHGFVASLHDERECITCRLPERSCAHHDEWHNEKHDEKVSANS